MLSFLPSQDEKTIAVQFTGEATKEDAERLEQHVKEHFPEGNSFNLLAIIHDIKGSSLKGMMEGMKFDAKHWEQFSKLAVVTGKDSVESLAKVGKYLPGITVKQFEKDQLSEAWDWLQKK
ncbi:STAS/SEC14 domain-containing protein [Sediminibacillus dalangtanensis]|uniref:STAS/SEC14 domain-containing protein n=1 Tax=Sediminibacillus dalangtanensis TaxID=2729421 RepID=A0ABX7VS21_9BACI|nr:STAS/SEC14 domain-containing protein [Sediminibacillus dalangtanensis]QTM99737.1 STAS/SEC14 domain-containing protein [Sediminibacillus dalangtanensis]